MACNAAGVSPTPDAAGRNGGRGGGAKGGSGGKGGSGNPDSGGGQPDVNCGLVTARLERQPPEVVMVFDRSFSMVAPVEGTGHSRFEEATTAIFDVLMKTNDTVLWGLKLFPTGAMCAVTPGVDVPVGAHMAATVTAGITALPPGIVQGTPTHLAVAEATAHLKMRTTDNPKFILVVTDGEPNCAVAADTLAVTAIETAAMAGFHTVVVGIATAGTDADNILNAMADAGREARAGATRYYPATKRDELTTTLGHITGAITTNCVYPLTNTPPSPDDVAVNVGAMRITRDASNGWTYGDGMNSVVLKGAACDLARSGQGDVTIVFGCPGIVIP
jgi:hypothetical protein